MTFFLLAVIRSDIFLGSFLGHYTIFTLEWPSGPRRLTQVQVSTDAWVRIPLQALCDFFLSNSFDLRASGRVQRVVTYRSRAIGLVV